MICVAFLLVLLGSLITIPFATSNKTTAEIVEEIEQKLVVYPHIDRATNMEMLRCDHIEREPGEEGTYYFDLLLGTCV